MKPKIFRNPISKDFVQQPVYTDPVQSQCPSSGRLAPFPSAVGAGLRAATVLAVRSPRLCDRPMADTARPFIPPFGGILANKNGLTESAANGNWERRRPSLPRCKLGLRSVAREPRPPSRRPQPRSQIVIEFKLPSRSRKSAASVCSSLRAAAVGRARGSGG